MFWSLLLLCCTSSTTVQLPLEVGWEDRIAILEGLPTAEQELQALVLLRDYPQQYETLCGFVSSKEGRTTCQTYATRPHLWTISSQDAPYWSEGFFFSRILFPNVVVPKVQANDLQCTGSEDCIFQQAHIQARKGKIEEVKGLCASLTKQRQRWECMFQSSEKIEPADYTQGVALCLQSGSFAPECHNHLVLRLVQNGWLNPQKHEKNRTAIQEFWSDPAYVSMLLDVYWSALSSRVLGVTQPFSVEDVPVSSPRFIPHLHSAIALRVIFSDSPFLQAKKSMRETMQLTKAHGPNSPLFQPKRVWTADTQHEWIHFCDIRGGIRPTSQNVEEDLKLALMTAAMMTIPPKIHIVHELASEESSLLMWAKEQLLSTKK